MSPSDLKAFFEQRHGQQWYGPASEETGYSLSHLWRIANEERPVSRKLEITIKNLKPKRNRTEKL